MRRFETLANRILGNVPAQDLLPLLETLTTADLVGVLAGIQGEDMDVRYRKNVIATELLNRVGAGEALLEQILLPSPRRDLLRFTSSLARAVRADVACIDEVAGEQFVLHGKFDVPPEMERLERCHTSRMAMCEAVLRSGQPMSVCDIPLDPRWADAPAHTKFGLRSYAGAPGADADGRVAVVLWVASCRPREFSAEEMFLLERVAQRVAEEFPQGVHPYPSRATFVATPEDVQARPPPPPPPGADLSPHAMGP